MSKLPAVAEFPNCCSGRIAQPGAVRARTRRRPLAPRSSAILAALGAALVAGGCDEVVTERLPEVRPVRTVVAEPGPVEDDRSAVGEIKPRHESALAFRVAGKIVARLVDVGTTVRAGDLLAQLDDQDFRNKARSAEADLAGARAALAGSQATESRQRQLLASGVTTRANYDVAFRNLRSDEARVDSAVAALDLARDQLVYAALRAEFDGIVTAVSGEPGQVVNAGQAVLKLARPDDKDAVFAIAESVLADRGSVHDRPRIVTRLLSQPTVAAEGTIREISPVADPTTRTFQVKVTLENPPEQMRFGASVVGRVKAVVESAVVLPGSALSEKSGAAAVWVLDPATGTVQLRPVLVARYETDRVVVARGLAKGDIVVTAGVDRLREGQPVRRREVDRP